METQPSQAQLKRADTQKIAAISLSQATRFRQAFVESGYLPPSPEKTSEVIELRARGGQNLPRLLRLTSEKTKLNTLARLFLLGVPVSLTAARETLQPIPIEEWCDAGLLCIDGDQVEALVAISVIEGLLLASEKPELLDCGADSDYVNSATNSSATLARFMVPRRFARVLDLCTGCGILGFLAAQSSEQIVATDLNPRAIQLATFNARLNGISNIQFATGSLFEPVAGCSFDLITANPPCIIGPASHYSFRDSGIELDGFCRQIIAEAPAYLNEGGIFQCTLEWPNIAGAEWKERILDAVQNLSCDVLLLHMRIKDIHEHSEETMHDTEMLDPAIQQAGYDNYIDYFTGRNVVSISEGLLALRKRTASSNWVHLESLPPRTPTQFGEAVARYFEATDIVDSLGADLLNCRVGIAPSVAIETSRTWNGSAWEAGQYQLRQIGGFQFSAVMDLRIANLIRTCDGTTPLRDLISALAKDANVPFETVSGGCLSIVQALIRRGFLTPQL